MIVLLLVICWELRDINAKIGVEAFSVREYLSEIQRNTVE